MSVTKWAVNIRLENAGVKTPKEATQWALKKYALVEDLHKVAGFYFKLDDGGVAFLGSPFRPNPFPNCFGWFPAVFPYDDPYQSVYKGMTAEQFIGWLETLGYKEDKGDEV